MDEQTPQYVVRGKLRNGTDSEVLRRYMSQVMTGILGASLLAETPVIDRKPRPSWMSQDWEALHESGEMEDKVYQLLGQEDPEELTRVFNFALTVASNGVIAMNQVDFLSALGSVMVNVLAAEGGIDGYLANR